MKIKSKFFRVAVEGQTTDGRKITREQIAEMAANYNPEKYGARIWLEHIRGLYADSSFPALGDVAELKAEEIKDGELKGKLGLYASIIPTPELLAINQKSQKIYTSIEMDTQFSDSGQAYMYGLAITDSPASLGTEALQFSAEKPAAEKLLASRKARPENLFSAALEAEIEMESEQKPDDKTTGEGFFTKIKDMLKRDKAENKTEFNAAIDEQNKAITLIAEGVVRLSAQIETLSNTDDKTELTELTEKFTALQAEFTALQKTLAGQSNYNQRPPASGGDGEILADC
jgi:hypothetical protein